ncbi:MAG: MBL fold metallo-hydrolase [Cytophagales bacterium]|nr:MBL fold metallo-hydrolase [Cytophagales bacterium]
MNLYVINTGFFKLDGGAMFGVVPKSLWQRANPPDDNNMCSWALRCLLIEDGDKLTLIDNGIGNKQSEKFFSYYYMHGEDSLEKSLNKAGFSPDDITDAFLTHLHFDHCGGSLKYNGSKIELTFKNATYWSNKAHWHWASHPNAREKASFLKENILPIEESGHLKFVSPPSPPNSPPKSPQRGDFPTTLPKGKGDGKVPPLGGFRGAVDLGEAVFFADGHTEKMMIPLIRYKNKTIAYMADLIPSAGHIPIPYVMGYDVRPLQTMKEKEIFLNKAVEEEYILFFEHDPVIECCTLQQTEKGVRVKETFYLKDI